MPDVTLEPKEMDKLVHLWEFHRQDCKHAGDASIKSDSSSGIGTTTTVTCGCGKEMNVTNYLSW